MHRILALAIVAVLANTSPAGAAGTSEGGESTTTTTTDIAVVDSTLAVEVGHESELTLTSSRGGRPGRAILCTWWNIQGISFHDVDDVGPISPVVGMVYEVRCHENGTMLPGFPIFVVYDPLIPPPPTVTVEAVAEHAADSVTFTPPTIEISPSADQVVGVPTWLAVTSDLTYPTVYAAAGPVWAEVTPVLRNVVFDLGNGDSVTCTADTDLYTTWDPSLGDDQTSACTYTYISNGDADGEMFITATATWDFAIVGSPAPTVALPPHTEVTIIPITVRELQAVID